MERLCQKNVSHFFIFQERFYYSMKRKSCSASQCTASFSQASTKMLTAHSPDRDSTFSAMGSSPLKPSANPHSSIGPEAWPRQTHQQGGRRNDPQNSGHNAGEEAGWGGLGLQLQLQEECKGHWIGVLIQGSNSVQQTCLVWLQVHRVLSLV